MKIYLVRHGRTNYNDVELCNYEPDVDVHLTPVGTKQITALSKELESIHFDRIFVSELRRTLQTAHILNASHDVPIEVDVRLNDCRSGFEGKPYPDYVSALDAADNRWTARFNGGESIEDFKVRAARFVDDLLAQKYDTVLVVTSEWIIRAMLTRLQNLSNEEAWGLEIVQGGYLEVDI